MNAEACLRWLQGIAGDGPLTVRKIRQRGFFVEGGRFLVPRLRDANVRYSQVGALVGNSSEIAAGLSWRPLDAPRRRFSFDVADLDGRPLQHPGSDVVAGDDGTRYRARMQADFSPSRGASIFSGAARGRGLFSRGGAA